MARHPPFVLSHVIEGHEAFLCSTFPVLPLCGCKLKGPIFSEMFIKYKNTSLTSLHVVSCMEHGGFMMPEDTSTQHRRFDPEVTTQWSIAVRRNGVQPPTFLGTSTTWAAAERWREIARVLTLWSAVMARWGWVFGLNGGCHLGCMILWLQ